MAVQKVNFLLFAKMGNGGKSRRVRCPKSKNSFIEKFTKLNLNCSPLNLSKVAKKLIWFNIWKISIVFLFTFVIL